MSSTSPEETCWTLIRAAAQGCTAEREEFGRRYLPIVRRILSARWSGSALSGEVEDAAQEVFVACFRAGGVLENVDGVTRGFRAFLYGVTRNVALQMERARTRRDARFRPAANEEAVSWDSGLSRLFDREYALALLREAFETMVVRARLLGNAAERRVELLRCRFEQDQPIREIARLWEADPGQLHLEQAKAAREFRSALRQVVGLSERCAGDRIDLECARLLELLD